MAKMELSSREKLTAMAVPAPGAFPIRRGGGDADALDTAAAILSSGGLVVVFPEGARVEQSDALGAPRHGAGRLAIEAGVPMVQRRWRARGVVTARCRKLRKSPASAPAVEPPPPAPVMIPQPN